MYAQSFMGLTWKSCKINGHNLVEVVQPQIGTLLTKRCSVFHTPFHSISFDVYVHVHALPLIFVCWFAKNLRVHCFCCTIKIVVYLLAAQLFQLPDKLLDFLKYFPIFRRKEILFYPLDSFCWTNHPLLFERIPNLCNKYFRYSIGKRLL